MKISFTSTCSSGLPITLNLTGFLNVATAIPGFRTYFISACGIATPTPFVGRPVGYSFLYLKQPGDKPSLAYPS